eukprot:1189239-Pyramimonas_sp.AAC.3
MIAIFGDVGCPVHVEHACTRPNVGVLNIPSSSRKCKSRSDPESDPGIPHPHGCSNCWSLFSHGHKTHNINTNVVNHCTPHELGTVDVTLHPSGHPSTKLLRATYDSSWIRTMHENAKCG